MRNSVTFVPCYSRRMDGVMVSHKFLQILYLMILLDHGGAYRRSVYILLPAVIGSLYWQVKRNGFLVVVDKTEQLLLGLIIISALCGAYLGIDTGDSIYGMIRLATILLSFLSLLQWKESEREGCFIWLSYIGAVCVVAGIVIKVVPFLNHVFLGFFSKTGRLAGPFGYSNSMALFLLLGIVVLEYSEKVRKRCLQLILCFGVLLTGSRFAFVLLCCYIGYLFLKNRKNSGLFGIVFFAMALAVGIYSRKREELSVIGRFLTINLTASTLQGRILYWEDACKMLFQYPCGTGYMGYFYLQQELQTGVYNVRFVHNDWLQCMLDYGILAGIGAAVFFLKELCSKKKMSRDKDIIVLTGMYSFFDFHLQFLGIFLPVLLAVSQTNMTIRCPIKRKGILLGVMIAVIMLAVFAGLSEQAGKREDYKTALRWNPYSTEYRMAQMLNSPDLAIAESRAEKILKQNQWVYAAYKIKSNAAAERGEIAKFIENRKKALSLRKYDMKEYEEYFRILYSFYIIVEEEERWEEKEMCIEALKEIPKILDMIKRETSLRAYYLEDMPQMDFSYDYQTFIALLE